MKIKLILVNKRKKEFSVQISKDKNFSFPFSLLKKKPSTKNPVIEVYVDKELASEAFTYVLKDGKEDTILLEQVLSHNSDPEFIRENLLYNLTIEAQNLIKKSSISKRHISRQLKTSPAQIYRLLDQKNYSKTIDQMIKLLYALGKSVDFNIVDLAA